MPMREPEPWDDVFMRIAYDISKRSKDQSFQAGCVIVDRNNRVLGLGFNGPPPQIDDGSVPWLLRPDKYAYILHSEENALLAALEGDARERLVGGTLYVNGRPCSGCVLRMIRAGVGRCVYAEAGPQARMCDDTDWKVVEAIIGRLKPGHPFRLVPYRGPVGV